MKHQDVHNGRGLGEGKLKLAFRGHLDGIVTAWPVPVKGLK